MAKIPMVTRTMQTTHASCMVVDVQKGETFTKVYDLPKTYKSNEAILKLVKKVEENENFKPVAVVDVAVSEDLYAMPETKFIANAEKLPPRK